MNRIIGAVTAAVLMGTLCACASGPRLVSDPSLAKAKGTVSFKGTEERGTRITLKIKNLAEPEGLNPPGYVYVAWVQSDREADAHNIGVLVVDDSRKAELRTSTPLHDFELFVTAEASSDAPQPTGPPLLWTHRDAMIKLARRDEWSQLALGDAR